MAKAILEFDLNDPDDIMAHKRKDTLVGPVQWWKHLRFMKRIQNHKERQAAKEEINKQ